MAMRKRVERIGRPSVNEGETNDLQVDPDQMNEFSPDKISLEIE